MTEEDGWKAIPDEPLPPIVTLQEGEVFEGTYQGVRVSEKYDSKLHDFSDTAQEYPNPNAEEEGARTRRVTVSGRSILDRKMEKVKVGDRVRIMRTSHGETGNPAKFDVAVKEGR